ncbi:MAG TPA: TraR/DksA family transcriptional regulator [Albitalea sp.]
MTPLSDAQRHTIEELLSGRELELQARVREAKAAAAERPSAQGPQVEDAAEEGEQRFRTGIEHVELLRDQEELTDIAAARERLANGSYGHCADCGQDIAFQRLNAQPTATRCVICQEAYEKRHGSTLRYTV